MILHNGIYELVLLGNERSGTGNLTLIEPFKAVMYWGKCLKVISAISRVFVGKHISVCIISHNDWSGKGVLHILCDYENVEIFASGQRYIILNSISIFYWAMICHDKNILPVLYKADIYTNADLSYIYDPTEKKRKNYPAIKILYPCDILRSNVTRYWEQHERDEAKKFLLRLWTYKNNALEALVRMTVATRVQEKISTQSQYKDGPLRYGDSRYKIRLLWDLPICKMRIPILVSRYLYIETTPRVLGQCNDDIF